MLQSPEEDRIVIIGLPICPLRVDTLPIAVEVTLGACLPYPLWRGIGLVAVGLRGRETQRAFLALGHPALRGSIHHDPIEPVLLRLNIRPCEAQVNRAGSREFIDRVRRGEVRSVIGQTVVVMMKNPSPPGRSPKD